MPRIEKHIPFALFAIFFVISPKVALGEEAVKSNLDVVTQLATEVAEELLSGFRAHLTSEGINLAPYATNEAHEFLTNVFTRTLTERGFKAYSRIHRASQGDSISKAYSGRMRAMTLEFQAFEFSLSYPKIFRSYIIGGKKIRRRAEITVFAKLLDPGDQSVVWVGEASRSYEDQFPYSVRPMVEEGLFDFTKPPGEPTRWGRVIEPIVVSGIIVGLVYLFFSNQSDS